MTRQKNVSLCRPTTKRDVLILWSNSSKNLVRIHKEFHFNLLKKNFFASRQHIRVCPEKTESIPYVQMPPDSFACGVISFK